MRTLIVAITFVGLTFAAASGLSAQEMPTMSAPAKEHEWLKKFVGTWDVVSGGQASGEAVTTSSMLGDLWVVNASDMEVSGMKMKSIQMIGYDTEKQKYVGMWADSAINFMWQYEGTLDESGKKLTLDARGPSMTGDGKMVNYRDAYEFEDDDTIISTSYMQDAAGEWNVIMEGKAKRRAE